MLATVAKRKTALLGSAPSGPSWLSSHTSERPKKEKKNEKNLSTQEKTKKQSARFPR